MSPTHRLHHDTQSGQIKAEPECGGQLSLTALRQTEGLIASIIALLGLDLAVPDIQRSLAGPRAWTWFVFGLAPVPCTCWSKALG